MEMQTRHVVGCTMWIKCEPRNEGAEGRMLFAHGKACLDLHPILDTNYISRKTGTKFRKLRED